MAGKVCSDHRQSSYILQLFFSFFISFFFYTPKASPEFKYSVFLLPEIYLMVSSIGIIWPLNEQVLESFDKFI